MKSSFSTQGSAITLGYKGTLVNLFLVYPKVGVLHEVFLLFAIVVLRHRPEIEVLVLGGVLSWACLFFGADCFLRPLIGVVVGSSCSHESLVLKFHDFSLKIFVFLQ